MDPQTGTPHGKQSWARWDPSTAAVVITFTALVFLFYVHVSVSGSASLRK